MDSQPESQSTYQLPEPKLKQSQSIKKVAKTAQIEDSNEDAHKVVEVDEF